MDTCWSWIFWSSRVLGGTIKTDNQAAKVQCVCEKCCIFYTFRCTTCTVSTIILFFFCRCLLVTKEGWERVTWREGFRPHSNHGPCSHKLWPHQTKPLAIHSFYMQHCSTSACSACFNHIQQASLSMQASSLHPCQCSSTPISIRALSTPNFHHLFYVLAPAALLA